MRAMSGVSFTQHSRGRELGVFGTSYANFYPCMVNLGVLEDFSFTFIDVVIGHAPFQWSRSWMAFDDSSFRSGLTARAWAVNRAWIRVGLFGGGFGVLLDNGAEAVGYLLGLRIPILEISMAFQFDATYRVNVPAGLLRAVNTVITIAERVLNAFESVKRLATRMIARMLDMCCVFSQNVQNMVDRIASGDFADTMFKHLPAVSGFFSRQLDVLLGVVDRTIGAVGPGILRMRPIWDRIEAGVIDISNQVDRIAVRALSVTSRIQEGVDMAICMLRAVSDQEALTSFDVSQFSGITAELLSSSFNNVMNGGLCGIQFGFITTLAGDALSTFSRGSSATSALLGGGTPPSPPPASAPWLNLPEFSSLLPLDGIRRLVAYVDEFVSSIDASVDSYANMIQTHICGSDAAGAVAAIGERLGAPAAASQTFRRLLSEGPAAARRKLNNHPWDLLLTTYYSLLTTDYLLLTTYYVLRTTCYLLLASY